MNHNKIAVGSRVYLDTDVVDGSCFIGNSLPGDELSIDTLTVTISSGTNNLSAIAYGSSVDYWHDNVLVGKFYLKTVYQRAKGLYELTCVSAVGLLDRLDHYGGLYNGTLARTVIADIIGGAVSYTVDATLGAVPIYGWLPVGSRRDNLRQILFALGGALKKDTAGTIQIKFLTSESPREISDDRLIDGGSVDYQTPVTGVAVTEHSYGAFATDEAVTLFDGQIPNETITTPKGTVVSGLLVTFSEPARDLSVSVGSVLESGVNYAVIGGASRATLTGKKYTHMTRVISRAVDNLPAGAAENIAKVQDATLVSAANSINVAERVLAYYSAVWVIKAEMVFGSERPGDAVALNDPFNQRVEGLLRSQDINISNTLVADTEIACGYVPSGGGNNFSHSVVLTGSGAWKIPADAKKIRAIIIGGGRGGDGGGKGENGAEGEPTSFVGGPGGTYDMHGYGFGKGGDGGKAGDGGSSGKVYEVDIKVTPGASVSYSAGKGGAGGAGETYAVAPKNGSEGTVSVFGGNSSASGSIYPYGYIDMFTGKSYAKDGTPGTAGGSGSGSQGDWRETIPGDTLTDESGNTWNPGEDGELHRYGASGACGGSGGGAAIGSHGGGGGDGYAPSSGYTRGGNGGDGATPTPRLAQSTLGAGGFGGHGGGGGGGTGETSTLASDSYIRPGSPGSGGNGGLGGAGGDGCIIIYY